MGMLTAVVDCPTRRMVQSPGRRLGRWEASLIQPGSNGCVVIVRRWIMKPAIQGHSSGSELQRFRCALVPFLLAWRIALGIGEGEGYDQG